MQEPNAAPATQANPEEVKVQAKNFAELRSIAESAKQENVQLKQRLAQLEESMKRAAPKEIEDSNEPYVDHNRLRKEMDKLAENMASTIDKKAEEKARALILEERRNEYLQKNKDFHEVMQGEEIEKFIQEYPHLAGPMAKMPDNFERQQLVYETMKTLKSAKPAPNAAPPVQKSALAQAFEARKPQMAYSPGGSAGGPFQSIGDFSQGGMKNAYDRYKSLQKTVSL